MSGLPGDAHVIDRLRTLQDGERIDIRGDRIANVFHVSKCHDCGMGTCDAAEYHPWLACQVFKRTHDSREVWRALRRAAQEGTA